MHSWVGPLVSSAKYVIADATEAAHAIKTASPTTKIFMDEVGILLGIAPFNMSDTLGNGSLSSWWNIQAVVWALFTGELAAAGVDMIGASQFVGWPCQTPWYDYSHETCSKALFEPSPPDCGQAAGNYPEMSVIDWTNGKLNARGWTMKLLIDGLGNADKAVLQTNVTKLGGGSSRNASRRECQVKTKVVDQDMQGGDVCEFNMSSTSEPSHAACGRACCANKLCDHFVSVSGDPPFRFKGGGVCHGQPPCAQGGFCCFLKTNAARPIKSSYKPGTAISGTTTPSPPATIAELVYARAFAPAVAAWPGPERRAVLLANFDSRHSHTVELAGDGTSFHGAALWSVVHGVSGAWDEPYARRKSTQETLTMEPLAVYLAFLPTKPSKTDDSASAVPRQPTRAPALRAGWDNGRHPLPILPNVSGIKVYNATPESGVYSHAPMISYHNKKTL